MIEKWNDFALSFLSWELFTHVFGNPIGAILSKLFHDKKWQEESRIIFERVYFFRVVKKTNFFSHFFRQVL